MSDNFGFDKYFEDSQEAVANCTPETEYFVAEGWIKKINETVEQLKEHNTPQARELSNQFKAKIPLLLKKERKSFNDHKKTKVYYRHS